AILCKRMGRAEQLGRALDEGELLAAHVRVRAGLAVQLDQLRLVVEHVERGRRPGHVQIDDVLCFGREVWLSRGKGIVRRRYGLRLREQRLVEQRGQRNGAQADAAVFEELAAG